MKTKMIGLFSLVLVIIAYGCKKDNRDTIAGKWRIVKTTYHYAKDTTVIGTANDSYNFATDGGLTIQDHYEGAFTGKYSQTSTNKIGITIYTVDGHGLGVTTPPAVYTVSYSNANNMTLTSPPIPAGQTVTYMER